MPNPWPDPWQPAEPLELQLQAARDAADVPALLVALARAELQLILAAEPGQSWAVSWIGGEPYVVVFTSGSALAAAGLAEMRCRTVRFPELAAVWPDPGWSLAINPGLALETFLDRRTVADLAAMASAPATELEDRLGQALADDDVDSYVLLLLTQPVTVPMSGQITDVGNPDFAWVRTGDDQVVVFTSPSRLQDVAGPHPAVQVSFAEVASVWPDGAALMVDPGLAHGGLIDAAVMQLLRERIQAEMRAESAGA